MKTLAISCMMALLMTGCEQGDPVAPSANLPLGIGVAFQIINSDTGKDLFLDKDTYNVDDIEIHINYVEETPWRDSIRHEQRGDSTILILPQSIIRTEETYSYILRLTASDYDTVDIYTKADIEIDSVGRHYADLKKIRIHYNGNFIEERNFTGNADEDSLLLETIRGDITNTFYKDMKKE